MAKVIHVHLLHNIDGTRRKDWYFSSISAVYTVLTAEQIGATKNYLLHAGLDNSALGILFNIDNTSVTKSKQRIKKKLGLGPNDVLETFLNENKK